MISKLYTFLRDGVIIKFALELLFLVPLWSYFFFFWLPTHGNVIGPIGGFFIALVPFVLPFLLWQLLVHMWFDYFWTKKYVNEDHCLLEIKLPEEIHQSPYAAELMLRGIYQTGEVDTPIHSLWGVTKPWFSLEIVSTEGRVHFYVWTRRRYKALTESQIYAHYPSVHVVEVPDYTLNIPYDPAVVDVWGIEQALQKPDPYPILTYVEIGLDKQDMKEEFKHDPLNSLIEFLGALGKGEHVWTQIIIRAHNKSVCSYAAEDRHIHKAIPLEEWTKLEVDNIVAKVTDEKGKINFAALTHGDKLAIEAMQTKLNKQAFDVGIRSVYISRKENTRADRKASIPSSFRSFEHGSEGRGLNGLKPVFWIGPFNFKWHDFMNIRRHMLWKRFYDAYITRQYFYPPHKHRHIVLNSEEIATIFHFPGKVAQTPTLERLPSKRAEAPSNLPT